MIYCHSNSKIQQFLGLLKSYDGLYCFDCIPVNCVPVIVCLKYADKLTGIIFHILHPSAGKLLGPFHQQQHYKHTDI